MPRQARIDIPNFLQHVIAKGIGQDAIFRDEIDYTAFLERLALVLEETRTKCYAWALLPNHFHLLLRPSVEPLSKVMRRLMTGYAVSFNKRNKRNGRIFQNRYQSLVCEDIYLKELAGYIHLNPIRMRIVSDLNELDRYAWTGHSVLVGRKKNPLHTLLPEWIRTEKNSCGKSLAEESVKEMCLLFGDHPAECRKRYRQFMKKRVHQGKRPDLKGGGWSGKSNDVVRQDALRSSTDSANTLSDQRILGNPDFVMRAIRKGKENEEVKRKEMANKLSLPELIKRVCHDTGVDIKVLTSSKRDPKTSHARAIISYLAVSNMKYTLSRIARELRLSGTSVSRCVIRGKRIAESDRKIFDYVKN